MRRDSIAAAGLSVLLHALCLAGITRVPWSPASARPVFKGLDVVEVVLLAPHGPKETAEGAPVPPPEPSAVPPQERMEPPAAPEPKPVPRPPARVSKPAATRQGRVAQAPPAVLAPPPSVAASEPTGEEGSDPTDLLEKVAAVRGGAAGAWDLGDGAGTWAGGAHGGAALKEAVPRYDVNPRPPYPETARRRGLQGTVLLSVLVRSNGTVGHVKLAKTCGHDLLDMAALRTVKEWQFVPGTRGERPVDMEIRVPVRFQLQ